jgi:predicted AAA+ superfamily ATPase
MSYIPRIADLELRRKLDASGAVLIRGPKACGKTETASQVSQSVLHADRDESVHRRVRQPNPLHFFTLRLKFYFDSFTEILNTLRFWHYT